MADAMGGAGTRTGSGERAARRLHLVGIGGSGLASLAAYLLGRGDRVSGCDQKDGPTLKLLREHGARIDVGHAAAHVDDAEAVVFTAAAPQEHPELVAAAARGLSCSKYARFLGEETRAKRCVAVAGTHGKTTTTTLLAEILVAAGLDPSAVVGGFPVSWTLPGRAGAGPHFVVEACEYDRSFTNFAPQLALVTNVEPDHLDYFGTRENVVRAFAAFLGNVARDGVRVLHESAAATLRAHDACAHDAVVVGEGSDADARLIPLAPLQGRPRGRLLAFGGEPIELAPSLPGEHNLVNAALAATAALKLGAPPAVIERAVRGFRGVRRRLEPVGERRGVRFLSDYAHHPTEIRAVRLALRASHPERRLLVVFQPHQASRTRDFRDDFAAELAAFDEVVLPNIFSVRESREGVERETENLVAALRERGREAIRTRGLGDVFETLGRVARRGDVVVLMGAGDIDDLAEELRGACSTGGGAEPPRELAREAGVA
jgi:UDP-N-acetylmuramate--alanine ligase